MIGEVKWFNDDKGFGFIKCDNYEDIFAHYSQILLSGHKSLNEGDIVFFELLKTEKGLQALNIQKLYKTFSIK